LAELRLRSQYPGVSRGSGTTGWVPGVVGQLIVIKIKNFQISAEYSFGMVVA
jgi:hypothetical protein